MGSKTRIVFLGSRPLGKRVLEFLISQTDVEIVGMVVLPSSRERYWIEDPRELKVPIISDLEELNHVNFDLGISVNYWALIKEPLLSKPKMGFLNVHHSYNLRLRGRNCTTLALLLARKENIWHHGSTLHYVSSGLDSGKIIASRACQIREDDTAFSLFNRVEHISFEMLQEWLPRVWREQVIAYEPPSMYHIWKGKDIDDRIIDFDKSALEIYDRTRAFIFPHFELPYVLINGERRYLTTIESESEGLAIDAGMGRRVFLARFEHA